MMKIFEYTPEAVLGLICGWLAWHLANWFEAHGLTAVGIALETLGL